MKFLKSSLQNNSCLVVILRKQDLKRLQLPHCHPHESNYKDDSCHVDILRKCKYKDDSCHVVNSPLSFHPLLCIPSPIFSSALMYPSNNVHKDNRYKVTTTVASA